MKGSLSIKHLALIILLQFCCSVEARVFDMLPFLRGGSGVDVSELMGDRKIMREPMTINGVGTTLIVSLIDSDLKTYLIRLKQAHPNLQVNYSQTALHYVITLENGRKERHYLTQVSERHPVVHFSMELPAELPKNIEWPRELPMPASAQIDTSISFDERGSTFASFSTLLATDHAQQEISNSLVGNGWQSTSAPAQGRKTQTGGFYYNAETKQVMVVSFVNKKDGGVSGSIYMKPLK